MSDWSVRASAFSGVSADSNTAHDTPAESTGALKARKTLLRVGITIVILVALFWQVRWRDVRDAMVSIDVPLLAWACLLWIPTQYLQFARWAILARLAGGNVSEVDIRRGYWVGFTLGLITPGRLGQYGRAFALHNCSLSRAIGLTFLERSYSAIVINGFGLLAIALLPGLGWTAPFALPGESTRIAIGLVGTAILLIGVLPRLFLRPLRWVVHKLPLRDKLERAIDVLRDAGPARGLLLLVLATAALASALVQFVLLLRALGADIAFPAGMLATLLSFFFKGALPISIGNLGVSEWAAMLCLRGLGVEPSIAVAASLLLFVLNVFLPSVIGLPFVSHLRVPKLPRLRRTSS